MSEEPEYPYKYSFEQLQEKYKDVEFFDILLDAQLAIQNLVELLRLGYFEIKEIKNEEKKEHE